MSNKNFYQSFYQNDQLFHVSNDTWINDQDVAPDKEALIITQDATLPITEEMNLVSELEALSAGIQQETALVEVEQTVIVESINSIPAETPLVSTPEPLPKPATRPASPPVAERPVLPELNHKVLLLADEELDPSNLLFLEKVLKAINLNIDGVDLLNLHGAHDLDFSALVQDKKIHHFITFGVPFKRIHLDIAMDRYQPIRFFGITFMMADSLPTIEADQNLKKRLWGALQRMFLANR